MPPRSALDLAAVQACAVQQFFVMETEALARMLQEFLADARAAVIVEDGVVMFEMA